MPEKPCKSIKVTNRDVLIPYLAPYLAYVAIASLLGSRLAPEWNYGLRLIAVPALLVWGWRWYVPLRGPKAPSVSFAWGVAVGLFGAALWIMLLQPFAATDAKAWSDLGFGLRLIAAGLLVPIFEELLMRGYFFRVALQWDRARKDDLESPFYIALDERSIAQVEPGGWSIWAVLISTAAFALGHQIREWPACSAYGLLMVGLWIGRKDLLSCVVAHGTTNIALAVYVRITGQWWLW